MLWFDIGQRAEKSNFCCLTLLTQFLAKPQLAHYVLSKAYLILIPAVSNRFYYLCQWAVKCHVAKCHVS